MVKTREDFKPDVGGFLDGVDGEIVDARFDIASGDYADKVMLGGGGAQPPVVIQLTVESPSLERPAMQSYSVGSQDIWEIVDDGKRIQNIKNPDRHAFRSGSRAYALVEAMLTAIGDGDLGKGQDIAAKQDRPYMNDAAFYTGFNFYWETQSLSTVGGGKTSVPLPSKFLGEAKKVAPKGGTTAPIVSNDALDKILVDNASGKSEKELKSFAVRNPEIKKDDAFMKAVVSGKKLRELENAGTLTLDPDTKTYL